MNKYSQLLDAIALLSNKEQKLIVPLLKKACDTYRNKVAKECEQRNHLRDLINEVQG